MCEDGSVGFRVHGLGTGLSVLLGPENNKKPGNWGKSQDWRKIYKPWREFHTLFHSSVLELDLWAHRTCLQINVNTTAGPLVKSQWAAWFVS